MFERLVPREGSAAHWLRVQGGRLAAMLVCVGLALPLAARAVDQADPNWLTAEDRAWLAAHPVVRMGVDPAYAPYAYLDADGRYRGISAEIMALVGASLGLRLELVPLPNWSEVLRAARARRVDIITTAAKLPEREAAFAFTRVYLRTPLVVMTRADTPDMASTDDIARARVALVRDYSGSVRVLERYPHVEQILVDDPVQALAAVAERRADAYVGVLGVNLYQARLNGFANLKVNVGFDLLTNGQRVAVRSDWAPLAAILDKAIDHIPAADRNAIDAGWLQPLFRMPQAGGIEWNAAERAWLAQRPEIRVGFAPDQAPFSFVDPQGAAAGLLVDTLRELAALAGLRLIWVPAAPQALLSDFRDGRLDLMLSRPADDEAQPAQRLTQPLYRSALMLICDRDADCADGLDSPGLQRVAVRQGSPAQAAAAPVPSVALLAVDSDARALQLLRDRAVQGVLGESRSLQRSVEVAVPPLSGLRFNAVNRLGEVQYRVSVRRDWPELTSILDRALESLGPPALAQLRDPWVGPPKPAAGLDRGRVLLAALAIAAMVLPALGLLVWANRRQRAEIRRRQAAESALAAERDRAESASRHKSEFVAHTSHELRTPLNAIVGAARLLEESPLDARQRELLRILDGGSRSLHALVDDLLDLARIESGRLVLHAAPFDLSACLATALSLVRSEAERKGLAVLAEWSPELPPRVRGDEPRLRQVLVNLLGNAQKYTAAGTIALEARVVSRDAQFATVEFAVRDTGPGIAAEWRERVFEPFQRAAPSVPDARLHTDGVGLGLGIARQVVSLMHGRLLLDSELGAGSRFHFRLRFPLEAAAVQRPAQDGEAAPAPQASRAARSAPAPVPEDDPVAPEALGSALVVEDNEVNRFIVRTVLERGGWRVEEAHCGARALEIMADQASRFDVILMDLGLPDMDGLDVTRHLRRGGGASAQVPIIGLTARAMPAERDACLAAGMVDVLLKPFEVPALWQALAGIRAAPQT